MSEYKVVMDRIGVELDKSVSYNLLGFSVVERKWEVVDRGVVYRYFFKHPSFKNFTLVINVFVPEENIPENVSRVGYVVNELFKYYKQKLSEYSLLDLIKGVPVEWALVFDVVVNNVFDLVQAVKHVVIRGNSSYFIKLSEVQYKPELSISVIKKNENVILSKSEMEKLFVSLNMLKEFALYDTVYGYRGLIYKIRLVPLLLVKYSNLASFKFNNLTILFNGLKMIVVKECCGDVNTFKTSVDVLNNQGWQESLIKMLMLLGAKSVS